MQIESGLPRGVQQGVEVDGTIEVGHLSDVVQVGRPVEGQANSEGSLFKLEPNGDHAERVKVKFGGASVDPDPNPKRSRARRQGDPKRHLGVQGMRPASP